MIRLVRPSGKVKPIGEASTIYKSRLQDMQVGDVAEVTDNEGNTLNIAKVTAITDNQNVTIVMIA